MHLTISRNNQSHKQLNKNIQKDVVLAPFSLQPPTSVHILDDKQSKTVQRENAPENTFCKDWIFSNCLKKSRDNSQLLSARFEQAERVGFDCLIGKNKRMKRSSKIKVMSCLAKLANQYETCSQSLKKIKNLRNSEESFSRFSQDKINEILQAKNCTSTHPSPFISREISTKKKDQGSNLIQSFNHSGLKVVSDKKLLLTISRELKVDKKQEASKYQYPSLEIQRRPQALEALIRPQSKTKEQSICTHLRMSSNQFKIVDPLSEMKSLDTEYLKNKIAFSEARTEKEGKTERQAIIDCLYEPIKILDWTIEHEARTPLYKKKQSQIYRSQAIRNITVVNQHQLTEVSKYSGESIVLEKGLADVFNIQLLNEHKISAQTKPRQSFTSSMIKYETSQDDEQQQWYELPLRFTK